MHSLKGPVIILLIIIIAFIFSAGIALTVAKKEKNMETLKIASEYTVAGQPARILRTGIFVSNKDFELMMDLRKEYLNRKNLPELTDGRWYGWDYSGRIIKMHPELGREEELDVYFTSEEMDEVKEFIDGIVQKHGFPKSTERCVIGIQKNKEITVSVKRDN